MKIFCSFVFILLTVCFIEVRPNDDDDDMMIFMGCPL